MRAPRLLVAALVAALGITLLVAPSPATAVVRVLKTTYHCETNGHSGKAHARIRVDLPRRVKRGTTLSRRVSVRMVLSAELTNYLRDNGADAVSGSSPDAYYRIGAAQRPIRHLHVPRTPVPDTGNLVLHARGRAAAYTYDELGRVRILVGHGFTTEGTAYGTVLGDFNFTMGCNLLLHAPAQIATIRVVR